jgi:hypothetical protein
MEWGAWYPALVHIPSVNLVPFLCIYTDVYNLYYNMSMLLRARFKNPVGDGFTFEMSPHIFAAQNVVWIDSLKDCTIIVELWVQSLEILWLEGMLLGPMRSTLVGSKDFSESFLEFSVRDRKTIRSESSARVHGRNLKHLPVRDDTDPSGLPSVTGTEPDVIGAGPSDLDGKVSPESAGICCLGIDPVTELFQALLGVLRRDRPLQCVLRELG